jgi:ribosome-associated protein
VSASDAADRISASALAELMQALEPELEERFVRASGPGGQNVNKVSSAVELRLDIHASSNLPETLKAALLKRRDRRITQDGVLVLDAMRFRTQEGNRADARRRLSELLSAASYQPKARVKTKPSRASKERRLQGKKQRSQLKRDRRVDFD